MKAKSSRRHIDVNVEELDRTLDSATQTAMTKSDCQKIKAAVHAMADRLRPKRTTEKTSSVTERPAATLTSQWKPKTTRLHPDTDETAPPHLRAPIGWPSCTPHSIPETLARNAVEGRVYRQKQPATLVRIIGQAPLAATAFEMDRMRCNACGEIFTADQPEETGTESTTPERSR